VIDVLINLNDFILVINWWINFKTYG